MAGNEDLQMMRARRENAHRKRRLILDDDGDVVYDDQVENGVDGDQLRIVFNNTGADIATIAHGGSYLEGSSQSCQDNAREGSRWMDLPIQPGAAKQGSDAFQISIAQRGSGAQNTLTLKQVWVVVQYQSCSR